MKHTCTRCLKKVGFIRNYPSGANLCSDCQKYSTKEDKRLPINSSMSCRADGVWEGTTDINKMSYNRYLLYLTHCLMHKE